MSKIYLAFYHKNRKVTSPRTLGYRLFDTLVKVLTLGEYSHCEIAIKSASKYRCYSSSWRDGGVRVKRMSLPEDTWDLIDISHLVTEEEIMRFFEMTKGTEYDIIGLLSPLIGHFHSRRRWFCSEWCAAAIGFDRPHKLSPVALRRLLRRHLPKSS